MDEQSGELNEEEVMVETLLLYRYYIVSRCK